jgi:hypothetical protein
VKYAKIIGLLVIGALVSCSSLGTKVKVFNGHIYKEVSSISILPLEVRNMNLNVKDKTNLQVFADSVFRTKVENEHIWKVVKLDSSEIKILSQDIIEMDSIKTIRNKINAIIRPSILFIIKGSGKDIIIELDMKDVIGDKILKAKYSTFLGKSYLIKPSDVQLVNDAIDGIIKSIIQIKNNNKL